MMCYKDASKTCPIGKQKQGTQIQIRIRKLHAGNQLNILNPPSHDNSTVIKHTS